MNRSELEKLFGPAVEIEELAHYTEDDIDQYLRSTGYEGNPSEIVRSIHAVIGAATLGSMTSERKAASSRENGKKGGRPQLTPYERAERRVNRIQKLSQYTETCLYDWPEGDEHYNWIATARVSEIVDWAKAIEKE